MKFPKFFIIYLFIVWPVIMFTLVAEISGKVCLSYQGFAVDNESNLYIAKNNTIEVRDCNNEVIRNIYPFTNRGYKFTITKDNYLEISTGTELYKTDLYGNIISEKEIHDYTDDIRGLNRYKYVTSDGTVYVMKKIFSRTSIYRLDGEKSTLVYRMPAFDFIVKMLSFIVYFGLAIVIILCIKVTRKNNILK